MVLYIYETNEFFPLPNNSDKFPSASMFNMIVQAINYLHNFSNLICRKGQGFWKKSDIHLLITASIFFESQIDISLLCHFKLCYTTRNVFAGETKR